MQSIVMICTLVQISEHLFFSSFLADFDAQYGKLGVFGVKEFIFGKKCRDNKQNNVIFVIIVF